MQVIKLGFDRMPAVPVCSSLQRIGLFAPWPCADPMLSSIRVRKDGRPDIVATGNYIPRRGL